MVAVQGDRKTWSRSHTIGHVAGLLSCGFAMARRPSFRPSLDSDLYGGAHVPLATKFGGQVCAKDDKHQSWDVALSPYTSSKTNEVKISVEKCAHADQILRA